MGIQDKEGEPRIDSQEAQVDLQSIEVIVANQVNRYLELGFHKEVYPELDEDKAKDRYKRDFIFPDGASQPQEYAGRFDIVVVVEPRIQLSKLHLLAKGFKEKDLDTAVSELDSSQVAEWIDTENNIQNLTEYPRSNPYLVFVSDPERYRGRSVEEALAQFNPDEVGCVSLEVTSLYLQHLKYFIGRGISAAGTRNTSGTHPGSGAPYIGVASFRRPYVGMESTANRYANMSVLSRGEKFIRLGV
jgi:hypothetical protein